MMKETERAGRAPSKPASSVRNRPNLLAGERLPPPPSQNRSRLKRERLLRAALELFERSGYEATSIELIAKRAHVATGGFYQYFRSKRQILLVLMSELLRKLEEIDMRPSARDVRGVIESVLRAGMSADLEYLGANRAWKEATVSDPTLSALDEAIRAWTTSRLAVVFGLLQQLPNGRRDVELGLFAAVMDHLFWSLLGTPLQAEPRTIEVLGYIIHRSLLAD
jgi:AcrR family transcriptional regulator